MVSQNLYKVALPSYKVTNETLLSYIQNVFENNTIQNDIVGNITVDNPGEYMCFEVKFSNGQLFEVSVRELK